MLQRNIIISELKIPASIGILEHEQNVRQPLLVDAILTLSDCKQPEQDEITHVLDYRNLRTLLINECQSRHTNLLETLCDRICQAIFDQFSEVITINLKVLKTEAFDDCAAVGIQQCITRPKTQEI